MEQVSEAPEQKTGFELLKMIEDQAPWIASKIYENTREQKYEHTLRNRYANGQELLWQAFLWCETTQGHVFWAEIGNLLKVIK